MSGHESIEADITHTDHSEKQPQEQQHGEQHIILKLEGLHCTGCADEVVQTLRAQPHITGVHLDWANNTAHVSYHAGMTNREQIERLVTTTGCSCEPSDTKSAIHDHGSHTEQSDLLKVRASSARQMQHLAHAVDMQPITMGTKHDRMQYEMPATGAHKHHALEAAASSQGAGPASHARGAAGHAGMDHSAMGHRRHEDTATAPDATLQAGPVDHAAMGHGSAPMEGMDHSKTGHGGHGGHGGMDHDMSDPGMAAAMALDMRNKFFIALLLTIPTVLYSPLGVNLIGVELPTFGLGRNLIMLALSTPVVFYCGWIFISGAYYSLRRRMLNMSVLIATGVLAAYLASLLLTVVAAVTLQLRKKRALLAAPLWRLW